MALTKEEQEELDALKAEVSSESGLTAGEEQELATLKADVAKSPNVSTLESVARGAGQGLTSGFQDEASAGLTKGMIKLNNLMKEHPALAKVLRFNPVTGLAANLIEQDATIEEPSYQEIRDQMRVDNQSAQQANPWSYGLGEVGGGLATTILPGAGVLNAGKGAKLATVVGKGALQGGIAGAGYSNADDLGELAEDIGTSALFGGGAGAGGETLKFLVGKGSKLLRSGGKSLEETGGKFIENATGATRAQAEKFAPGAGVKLYDEGIVQVFDSPGNIAKRAGLRMDKSNQIMDDVLSSLDARGTRVSKKSVIEEMKNRIAQFSDDPSQAPVIKQMQGIIDDIELSSPDAIPLQVAEKTKRGFQSKVKNLYGDPDRGIATKNVANVYKEAVEKEALKVDQNVAEGFSKAKKTYGLLAPIEEAAYKRDLQLNQSPWGGLLDTAAAGTGGLILGGAASGGDPGATLGTGLLTAFGRRKIMPRVSSTAGVGTLKAGRVFQQAPTLFNKIKPMFNRGSSAYSRTDMVLPDSQEFRQTAQDLSDTDNNAASNYMLSERLPNYRSLKEE